MLFIFHIRCNSFTYLNYAQRLEQKDINYQIIQRLQKQIANFARTG